MSKHAPVGGRLFTLPFLIAVALALVALYFLGLRFAGGLGAVANINDGYPWGIWVTVDVVIGTAFGCGGFAMALLVYILNRMEYHPLMRPALLAGLFGYTLGGVAVFFDLGRYWQMYNVLLPGYWQVNSVMFEVALCVAAYILVLWIEFSPAFFEKFGWHGAKRAVNKTMFFFIALGVLLPTMHQSSLGTMLVVLGNQLSPLWLTTALPLLFLVSALAMGYAIVVFESVLAAAAFRRPFETAILSRLAGVMVVVVALYLVLRLGDLIVRGQLGAVFAGDFVSIMFLIETILFILPLLILLPARNRASPRHQFLAAALLLAAASLYRINAYLIGYDPGQGWSYFPSVPEIVVTVGLFAFEVALYLVFVKKLPVLESPKRA